MYLLSKILFSDYFLLIPIFIIGFITSFEDFKYGKIKNKWIKIGFLWGLAIFSLYIFWNLFFLFLQYLKIAPSSVFLLRFYYLAEIFLNTSIALLVSFLMWHWKVWSAGDAKLFTLFSFLLPLKFYANTYLSYFPSFALLLNIFTIALGIFLIILIYNFLQWIFIKRKKQLTEKEKTIGKSKFKKELILFSKEIFNLLVIFFVIVNFFGIIFNSPIGKDLSYFFTTVLGLESWTLFIIILAAFVFLMRFLQKIKKFFYWVAIILLIWLFYKWFVFGQSPLLAIRPMLGTTAIIIFGGFTFRKMFNWYVNKKEIIEIGMEELKTGMRLTDKTINDLVVVDKGLFEKAIGNIYSDGLTEGQVISLKKFAEDKKIKKLEIYKPSPFAIWMFIGLIITIAFKGSIIQPFLK